MGIHSAHVVWGMYPRPVLLGGRAICFMRYAYGNAHGPCGMEAYGNAHELYGNAYERCDYFHGGMGYPSSWGQHASTIMQSVMTAEERGYPMEKELFDYVAERAEVLATNDASTQVTKDAAAAWKAAVAADASDEAVAAATDKLLDVLEGRPTTIDGVIAFAEGPAKQLMGEEVAAAMLAEQLKRKEAGAKYCNCPSCTAASELLAKFGRIEL